MADIFVSVRFCLYILVTGNIKYKVELKEVIKMAVKHIPTGIVHSGTKGGNTGCGFNTKENSSHWSNTSSKITCDKNGCKN